MSVTEADVMTLMGETQEASRGARQEEYSAAVERQYAYQAEQRASFGRASGLPLSAVPYVTGAALVSALPSFGPSGVTKSPSQLWQHPRGDPQVNFPPRGGVPPIEPPRNTLPVPYERVPNAGPWAFGIGGIGAILTGVIAAMWEGWPNALDPELGPYDTRAPSASPEVILSGPAVEDVAAGPTDVFGPPSTAGDNPPALPVPDFGVPDPAHPEDIGQGPVPESVYGPPQGARQPAPAPAPAPQARELPPWVWPVIGGIAALELGRAGRGSRSSLTLPLEPVGLTVINEPLLSSAQLTGAGPAVLAGGSGAWGESDERCNCQRKSGKKRKCLARAQLTWRSGPKKGRAAGTKCYRFAS